MTPPDTVIEQQIRKFHAEYEGDFKALMAALDEAKISHYSSGCGVKSVTFDLFPASAHVADLLSMMSLNRAHRAKSHGLKDASATGGYNPSQDFLFYLSRWSRFTEQAMRTEGDTPRGVAAARARLLMGNLSERLKRTHQVRPKAGRILEKKPANDGESDFSRLMRVIGLALEARERANVEQRKASHNRTQEHNYVKALAAAQEILPGKAADGEAQAA